MKITIALPAYLNYPIGGFNVHYMYANLLSRRGHDVTIVFPRDLDAPTSLTQYIGYLRWKLNTLRRNRPLVGSFVLDRKVRVVLRRDLRSGSLPDADVLIATSWHTAAHLQHASPAKGRRFYVVYDYEYWMVASPREKQAMEATFTAAFSIIATSIVVRDMVRSCGQEPVALIPCGTNFDDFGVDEDPADREPLRIGFPARKETFKGLADAIAAARILRDEWGDRLSITAFGSSQSDLPDFIEWLQYPDQVTLRRFYNHISVFVLPSHFEGWGLTGVEAMACGASLVVTDNGGSRDYAIDLSNCLVVPPKRPDLMAAAVSRLLSDRELRLRLAREGQRSVHRFNWDDAATALESVLATPAADAA